MPRVCGNIPPAGRRRTSRAADQPARLRPGPRLPGDLTRHSRSYVSRRLELRQGPDRRGIVRLVLERMLSGIVDFPAGEIGDDAIAVAPAARLDLRRIEAAILEQAAQPLLGPAPEIEWRGMNAQQEGRADEATTAGAQRLPDMGQGARGVTDVLEHLVEDDQVEPVRRRARAHIVIGIGEAFVAFVFERTLPAFAGEVRPD